MAERAGAGLAQSPAGGRTVAVDLTPGGRTGSQTALGGRPVAGGPRAGRAPGHRGRRMSGGTAAETGDCQAGRLDPGGSGVGRGGTAQPGGQVTGAEGVPGARRIANRGSDRGDRDWRVASDGEHDALVAELERDGTVMAG